MKHFLHSGAARHILLLPPRGAPLGQLWRRCGSCGVDRVYQSILPLLRRRLLLPRHIVCGGNMLAAAGWVREARVCGWQVRRLGPFPPPSTSPSLPPAPALSQFFDPRLFPFHSIPLTPLSSPFLLTLLILLPSSFPLHVLLPPINIGSLPPTSLFLHVTVLPPPPPPPPHRKVVGLVPHPPIFPPRVSQSLAH